MTNKNLTQFVLRKVKRRNRYCVLLTKLGTIVLTDQNDLACYRLLRPLAAAAVFMGACLASAAPPAMAHVEMVGAEPPALRVADVTT